MIYFKKIGIDGQVMIGKQDVLPTNATEITETEYNERYNQLREEAIKRAEAEALEFSQLNLEEGDSSE